MQNKQGVNCSNTSKVLKCTVKLFSFFACRSKLLSSLSNYCSSQGGSNCSVHLSWTSVTVDAEDISIKLSNIAAAWPWKNKQSFIQPFTQMHTHTHTRAAWKTPQICDWMWQNYKWLLKKHKINCKRNRKAPFFRAFQATNTS